MNKIILNCFFTLCSIIFLTCSTTKIPATYDVIKFDNKHYPLTKPDEIIIYSARIDITLKYLEIGTIKYRGEADIPLLKNLAAQNGANALLQEGNNYILIYYLEQKEREKDVKKI